VLVQLERFHVYPTDFLFPFNGVEAPDDEIGNRKHNEKGAYMFHWADERQYYGSYDDTQLKPHDIIFLACVSAKAGVHKHTSQTAVE
jgi:hypothetical protein